MNQEIHNSNDEKHKGHHSSYTVWGSSSFVGACLIVLGGYFLGREMGWLDYDFPFWAVFMILAGLWLVLSQRNKNR